MAKSVPHPPYVSVVIPIYNRADFVALCLPPLLKQTYPLDRYEIILVDDGSTDDTVMRARDLTRDWAGEFRLIQKPNGGPASARNAGYQAAQGELIAFLDSDCVAPPNWIEALVKPFTESQTAGVGAPVVAGDATSWVARYLDVMDFYRHRVRGGRVDYLVTGNVAFRRDALDQIGGFTTEPNVWVEDVEISYRLKKSGYALDVTSDGAVKHYGTPSSLHILARNLYRYGKGNYLLLGTQRGGRSPVVEIMRHMGAVVLGPVFILRRAKTATVLEAFSYWPLVVVEHTAFIAGMISGMLAKKPEPK
ncbi:MAG: glycosyltransferase [Anaerolineae bacterium]|nr:glycosyltransferase [Anaerolineae bacterium]